MNSGKETEGEAARGPMAAGWSATAGGHLRGGGGRRRGRSMS